MTFAAVGFMRSYKIIIPLLAVMALAACGHTNKTVTLSETGNQPADVTICKPIEVVGDSFWPIAEHEFTLENAQIAVTELQALLAQSELLNDDFFSRYHNASIMIEGWLQKKHIAELTAVDSNETSLFIGYFCDFLKQKAYYSH